MYSSYPSPNVSAAPRIGDWLNETFNLFGRNWVTWCVQGLICLVLPSVPLLLGGVALLFLGVVPFFASLIPPTVGEGSSSQWSQPPSAPPTLAAGIVVLLVGLVLTLLLSVYLTVGMLRTAARQLRGEEILIGDIFQAGDAGTVLRVFGAMLIVAPALAIGVAFCVVPGLLLAGLFYYVHPLIVEGGLGVGAALRESIRLTRPHLGGYVLWVLMGYLLQLVFGAIPFACIVAMPILMLMWMIPYRDATGGALDVPFPAASAIPIPEYRPRNEG